MQHLEIIGLAVALSMDAFAVAVANGAVIKELHPKHALRISLFFGAFQAGMPLVGWLVGRTFSSAIAAWDHWIAFGLLAFIGGRMIRESRDLNKEECKNCQHLPTLILLSVATSIDALAVGLSFAFLGTPIVEPVVIIGSITFLLSLAGLFIGSRMGHFGEDKWELLGGIVLIGIGVKILLEHLIG